MKSIISIAIAMVAVEAAQHDDVSKMRGYAPSHDAYHDVGYNPWEHNYADSAVDVKAWYSPYQEFAPPKKAYKPFPQDKTLYAICYLKAETNNDGILADQIEFAQVPGKAIQVRLNYVLAATELASFDIQSWQDTVTPWDSTLMGPIVNYMTEFDKYGRESHYQDPNRGRIVEATSTVADAALSHTIDSVSNQIQTLLLNLSGPESILGRVIKPFTRATVDDPLVEVADEGCVIQWQQAPELPVSNTYHHHRGAHHTNDHYRNNHAQAHYGYNAGNQYGGHRVGQHSANPNGGFSNYSPRSNHW